MLLFTIWMSSMTLNAARPKDSYWDTVAYYDNQIPDTIKTNIKYKGELPKYIDYVFIRSRLAHLYSNPDLDAAQTQDYPYFTKLKVIERLYHRSNYWYKVEDDNGNTGYVLEVVTAKRMFRFERALDKIHELQNFVDGEAAKGRELVSANSYSPNPANKNPKTQKDKYGTSWEQNTVGKSGSETIYVPDRSIMSIISTNGGRSLVDVGSIKENVEIPNGNIARNPKITPSFKKVVAIDIENQNTILFERNSDNEWEVISYGYTKTGIESQLGYETPKGFFVCPTVKYVMGYTDGLGRQEGSARYAMRFSGGGYMHGTPVAASEESKREFVMKQQEKLLGIFTGTRKCVRTAETHARFMFDWMAGSKINKNQNEHSPYETVVFIVF